MSSRDELRASWASLGVAFHGSTERSYDPETALMLLVRSRDFPEDRKSLSLAVSWLKKYSKLVHVERLQKQLDDLELEEAALLGAIAAKCGTFKDFRWRKLEKLV